MISVPLCNLVKSGNLPLLKEMINDGYDINSKNDDGSSLLMIAVDFNHPEIVDYLLSLGSDVNVINSKDETAVTISLKNNDCIKKVMSSGYIPNYSKLKSPELHDFSAVRNITIINHANKLGWDMNALNALGENILFDAVKSASYLDKLLKRTDGININQKSTKVAGFKIRTPLFEASRLKNLKSVDILLKYNVDINLQFNDKDQCVLMSSDSNPDFYEKILNEKKVDLFIKDKNGFNLLTYSAYREDKEFTLKLINHGLEINNQSKNGVTTLMTLAHQKKIDMIAFMIDQGALVNIEDINKSTVIDIARKTKQTELVANLEKAGLMELTSQDEEYVSMSL